MLKQITAVAAIACAGTALGAPFFVAGAQIGATGNFATPDIFPGVPAYDLLSVNQGVFWDLPVLDTNDDAVRGSNLVGAHPGYYPGVADGASGPDSGGVGALLTTGDPLNSSSDTSFNVGWFIPDPDDYVSSTSLPPTDIGGGLEIWSRKSLWLGRIVGENVDIHTVEVVFAENTAELISFELDGSGEYTPTGTLFAITVPVPGVPNAVDILLGDLIIITPSPGACALFGLAGLASTRRRRG